MKKITALTLVALLLFSFSGCFQVNIDLPNISGATAPAPEVPTTLPVAEPSTIAPGSETLTTLPVTTQAVTTTEYHDDYDLPAYTQAVTTTEAAPKTPAEMSQEELIDYFNRTLNVVKAQNLGFKKTKLTSILDLQLSNSMANSLVSFVKGALLSDTADETTVGKGESSVGVMSPSGESFVANLTAEDVSSVKAAKNGENTVIRVEFRDLTNPDKSSAYGRIFDFMTVEDVVNIYAPKVGATVAKENIEVVFSGCYAELTVDANDKIVNYSTYVNGLMNMKEASIKKVVTINTDLAITLASTTDYTNFVY